MKLNRTHVLTVGLTAAALAGTLLRAGARAQETTADSTSAFTEAVTIDAAPRRPMPTSTPAPTPPCCLWFKFNAGGLLDNFATPEPAAPDPAWAAWLNSQSPTQPLKGFDASHPTNRWFAHTFTLPTGNCINRATLRFRVRPLANTATSSSADSSNDTLRLGVAGSNGWLVWTQAYFGRDISNGQPVAINQQRWIASNYPAQAFVIDLSNVNANIPDAPFQAPTNLITGYNGLNVKRHLDVFIQDDTDVDWMTLEIEFCPCGSNDPT